MRRTPRFVVPLLVAGIVAAASVDASSALSVGFSGSLLGFAQALDDARSAQIVAAAGGDKKAAAELKTIESVVAVLADPATSRTYLGEMQAAAKAAKTVGTKLKSEDTLPPPLAPAALRYRYDLDFARTDLANLVAALSGAPLKKAKARLKKADAALAAAAKALAKAKPVYVELTQLAKAAKLLSPTYVDPALDVRGEPVSVAVDSTGNYVYVAEYGDTFDSGSFVGDVRQMQIFPDGSLSYLRPASVAAGLRPYGVVACPTAPYVYVGNSGEATISQFAVAEGGALQPLDPATATLPQGTGVAAIAVDGNGKFVFTIAYGNGGSPVTSWAIGSDGTLSPVGTAFTSDFPTSISAGRIDSSKGGVVATSARYRTFGIDPRIGIFSVGGDGAIAAHGGFEGASAYYAVAVAHGGTVVGVHETTLGNPYQFTTFDLHDDGRLVKSGADRPAGTYAYSIGLSKSGATAYVGNLGDETISVFGAGGVVRAPAPYGFAVTPDGKRLIVGNHQGRGSAANIVTVFNITGTTLSMP
jgi:DNA-binding beta-propeller fold protein YncE